MTQIKTHSLFDDASGTVVLISLDNKKVTLVKEKSGKSKATEKELPTEKEALNYFAKKEVEMLKKGFVLRNEAAAAGEPVLHSMAFQGYTGCLSFQSTERGIYVYRAGCYDKGSEVADSLVLIDTAGREIQSIALPQNLPWRMCYNAQNQSLLMNPDHYIVQYDMASGAFDYLVAQHSAPSFVAVSAKNIAYGTDGKLFIKDHVSGAVLEKAFDCERVSGRVLFHANLSQSGDVLALQTKQGVIELINTQSGEQIGLIEADFATAEQIEFADNDKTLLIRESYGGKWGVRIFDVQTCTELKIAPLNEVSMVFSMCFDAKGAHLALATKSCDCYIFDFAKRKLLREFKLEHTVKTTDMHFVGELLGVRTDLGCFSLYAAL